MSDRMVEIRKKLHHWTRTNLGERINFPVEDITFLLAEVGRLRARVAELEDRVIAPGKDMDQEEGLGPAFTFGGIPVA